MATTTKKNTSNKAKNTTKTVEAKDTETEVVESKDEVKSKKKSFDQEDGILCKSVTVGGLTIDGPKTSMPYRFPSYGSEVEIEYRDLVAILRSKRDYLFYPYIIVEDDDFIKEFSQLKTFYDEQYTYEDLKEILTFSPQTMIDTIKGLPKGAIETIKKMAATEVSNGELDSVARIKALDAFFGTELNLLGEMVNKE